MFFSLLDIPQLKIKPHSNLLCVILFLIHFYDKCFLMGTLYQVNITQQKKMFSFHSEIVPGLLFIRCRYFPNSITTVGMNWQKIQIFQRS